MAPDDVRTGTVHLQATPFPEVARSFNPVTASSCDRLVVALGHRAGGSDIGHSKYAQC